MPQNFRGSKKKNGLNKKKTGFNFDWVEISDMCCVSKFGFRNTYKNSVLKIDLKIQLMK